MMVNSPASRVNFAIAQLDEQVALDDEKWRDVLGRMLMPDELAFKLRKFHIGVVEFADDARAPKVSEEAELLSEIHLLHDSLRASWRRLIGVDFAAMKQDQMPIAMMRFQHRFEIERLSTFFGPYAGGHDDVAGRCVAEFSIPSGASRSR